MEKLHLPEKLPPERRPMEKRPMEKHWRSVVKTISWRITATSTTLVISYFITGSLALASLIGGIEFFSKIFLYYIHERIWNKVQLGIELKSSSDYQI